MLLKDGGTASDRLRRIATAVAKDPELTDIFKAALDAAEKGKAPPVTPASQESHADVTGDEPDDAGNAFSVRRGDRFTFQNENGTVLMRVTFP